METLVRKAHLKRNKSIKVFRLIFKILYMLTKKILPKFDMLYLTIPYLHSPTLKSQENQKGTFSIYLKNGGVLRALLSIYLSLLTNWKENVEVTTKIMEEIGRLIFFKFKGNYHDNLRKKMW